jgi:S-adenosyl-L-methionine hydrolase (adenosine-forming)
MVRVITLTTDFGFSDGYIASMKGVILGINPLVNIVDITHSIEPQSFRQASFILQSVWHSFPESTIHIVVVDPGVGSHRRAVIVQTPQAYLIAPDNGVLSYPLHEITPGKTTHSYHAALDIWKRKIPDGCQAVAVTKQEYWRHPVSNTFHGRDIFAPVAAHLSLEIPLQEFGEELNTLNAFHIPVPIRDTIGSMVGCIIHIDRFGNLITNFMKTDIHTGGSAIEIGNQRITNMSQYYAESSGLMAVIGSHDLLEISIKDGSAASILGARVGDQVKLISQLR